MGAPVDSFGEVVFNTSLSGYEEILSDPSYAGQFVTLTETEIGNVGVNCADMESEKFQAADFLCNKLTKVPTGARKRASRQRSSGLKFRR